MFPGYPDVIVCDIGPCPGPGVDKMVFYIANEYSGSGPEPFYFAIQGGSISEFEYSYVISNSPSYFTFNFTSSSSSPPSVATSSPYIIDVGSTVMLGGILMFFISYWLVGLVRKWNT